ncbi:MAG: hypothetical protein EBZ36_06770 [Acidobacteria bacterium]|nr:hypothetical protein [Acidobacteriota bacterium]
MIPGQTAGAEQPIWPFGRIDREWSQTGRHEDCSPAVGHQQWRHGTLLASILSMLAITVAFQLK